jgi:hypothetical protein
MEATTMRRVVTAFIVLPILVLALAAPAAAAPPLKESGTQLGFYSVNTDCSGATCTDTVLDAYTVDPGILLVCLTSIKYNIHTGRGTGEGSCAETNPSALTITPEFTVTLDETAITLFDCNRHTCTEGDTVVVSAQDSAIGPIFSETSRGTFTDGTCTYRYSSSSESAGIAGTMTIDGVTLEQQYGSASISEFTVSSRCN